MKTLAYYIFRWKTWSKCPAVGSVLLYQCQLGVREGNFTFSYSQKIPEGEQKTLAYSTLKGASEELSHGSRETLSTQHYCD